MRDQQRGNARCRMPSDSRRSAAPTAIHKPGEEGDGEIERQIGRYGLGRLASIDDEMLELCTPAARPGFLGFSSTRR
jgi:hypothetical protein